MKRALLPLLFILFTMVFSSHGQQALNLIVPVGHSAAIKAVAISVNNKFVASLGDDDILIVWEVESGKVLRTIPFDSTMAASARIYAQNRWRVSFSSDSKMIGITMSNTGLFRVWDVETGKIRHQDSGWLLSFTQDNIVYVEQFGEGYRIVSKSAKGTETVLASDIESDVTWARYKLTTHALFRDKKGNVWFMDAVSRRIVPFTQISPLHAPSFAFSDQQGLVICAEYGGPIHIYQHERAVYTILKGDYMYKGNIKFSSDRKYVRATCMDKTRAWSLDTFEEVKDISSIVFNDAEESSQIHENFEILEKGNGVITVHDKVAGKELTVKFQSHLHFDDGKKILGYQQSDISIVDARNAAVTSEFKSIRQQPVTSLIFDRTNSQLFCANGSLQIIDFTQSKIRSTGHPAKTIVHTDENILVLGSDEAKKIVMYDFQKQRAVASLDAPVSGNLQASGDRSYISWSKRERSNEVTLIRRLEDTDFYSMPRTEVLDQDPKLYRLLENGDVFWMVDGGTMMFDTDAETSELKVTTVNDMEDGEVVGASHFISYNSDASFALQRGLSLWTLFRLEAGEKKEALAAGHLKPDGVVTISADGNIVAYTEKKEARDIVVAERMGREIKIKSRLKGHVSPIIAMAISGDNKLLATSSSDHTVKLWRLSDGELLSTVLLLPNNEWAVYTPHGLFDASPAAMPLMYFVNGLETIDLIQLKDRFYEPNLLKKIISDAETLNRNVQDLSKLDLYPEVSASIDELKGVLTIQARNRGGGIGKIQVIVNGTEFYSDARELVNTPVTQLEDLPHVSITVDLTKNKHIQWGERNYIGVKSSNKQSYLVSKAVRIIYDAPKKDVIILNYKPSLYAIVSGCSDYENDDLDLKYAAKDAEDFATALEIAAPNLFEDRVYIKRFTSSRDSRPSKQNLIAAFHDVAAKAKQTDVVVIYFSGHGTNSSGTDSEFLYLTEEASTFTFTDPVIRKRSSLGSSEITELLKSIAAQKRVMIIDACASGRVVENLVAKKDIPSGTLKALDRMKDRVGTYIITGCASDAVSYEASRFGQGLLTYSVLSAMRGAALRDERFIDVLKMFQYCREEVPRLAENIGGIQEPKVFSPYGGDSFDIGLLTSTGEKERIPLSTPKPFFLRSNFQDESSFRDNISFGKKLDSKLSDLATQGKDSQLVFLDVSEFPGAYTLTGRYKIVENSMRLEVKLFKGEKEVRSFQIEGNKTETDELADKLIGDLKSIIVQLSED